MVRPAAIATALVPTVALADFGSWVSGLGTQDYVALGVLAFLVIFVIPSLVGDILENQADPAAAIAKKQQKLKDLEDKYSFLVGDAPAPAPAADARRRRIHGAESRRRRGRVRRGRRALASVQR